MVVPAGAALVYVSGMLPITMTGEKVLGTIEEQTAQCLQNVEGALRGAGVHNKSNIVKITAYISDVSHWGAVSTNTLHTSVTGCLRSRC